MVRRRSDVDKRYRILYDVYEIRSREWQRVVGDRCAVSHSPWSTVRVRGVQWEKLVDIPRWGGLARLGILAPAVNDSQWAASSREWRNVSRLLYSPIYRPRGSLDIIILQFYTYKNHNINFTFTVTYRLNWNVLETFKRRIKNCAFLNDTHTLEFRNAEGLHPVRVQLTNFAVSRSRDLPRYPTRGFIEIFK